MNLYILDRDPRIAAGMLCDQDILQHCNGVVQLLCTAYREHGELEYVGSASEWRTTSGRKTYAPFTLAQGECVAWVSAAPGNYQYTRRYARGVLEEYQLRFGDDKGHRHKTWDVYEVLRETPRRLSAQFLEQPYAMTTFPGVPRSNASHYGPLDVVEVHRYLYTEKRRQAGEYCKGNRPFFMK